MCSSLLRPTLLPGALVALCLSWSATAQVPASDARIDELTRRIEALERLLAPVIGQTEQVQRDQALLRADLLQLATQTREQLAAMPRQASQAAPAVPAPTKAEQAAEPKPADARLAPPDYLARARENIAAQAWSQAEFDASVQLAVPDQPEKQVEANYLLGRSLLGQGHLALAAEKFLSVYDARPPAALAAENLFYLGQTLQQLGLPDNSQLCAVYAETLQDYAAIVDAERIADIRKQLAQQNCQ